MLRVVMLSVIMLNVVMLSVIMHNVVAPYSRGIDDLKLSDVLQVRTTVNQSTLSLPVAPKRRKKYVFIKRASLLEGISLAVGLIA